MAINKLFLMIPVMLAARKLDAEDKDMVMYLRYTYVALHAIIALCIGYIYARAQALARQESGDGKRTVLVPAAAAQPFADPNEKGKKYKQVVLGEYVAAQSKQMFSSTFFSVCLTCGLHWYKGMITGMAIQVVMGPFGMFENPLFKLFVLGYSLESRVFDEKNSRDELEADDAIVDEEGNVVGVPTAGKAVISASGTLEEILLDTWDANDKADLSTLMSKLNKENINSVTKTDGWTPLMVAAGLKCKGAASAMRQMKNLGADIEMIDNEGWNALHWSCFHGSSEAAKVIVSIAGFDGISMGLHQVKDKDGKIALELAKAEMNDDVAKVLEDAISSSETKKSK